jgi:predicted O-methyltransferase YrrM
MPLPVAYITKSPEGTYYQIPEDPTFQSTEVEMQEFLYGLVRYLKPELVFESGSCLGFGTMALAMACNSNQSGRLISAEPELNKFNIAKERVSMYPCADVRNCASVECPELKTADLIFSDSSWEARRTEWTAAKKGCVFVVHDTRLDPSLHLMVKSNHGLLFDRGR